MNSNLPFVTVIIPTYKDWDRLRLCLQALSIQTYPRSCFEVIVVNNDPQSVPPPMKRSKNVRYLTEPQPGSYAARNTGIKYATGNILAFTDADCIPDEGWIEEGVNALESLKCQIVTGFVRIFTKERSPISLAEAYDKLVGFSFSQRKGSFPGGVTANLFLHKTCLEKVGMFNSKHYSGGDSEILRNAADLGCRIEYSDKAIVAHPARSSMKEMLQKTRRKMGARIERKAGIGPLAQAFLCAKPPMTTAGRILVKKNVRVICKCKALLMLSIIYITNIHEGINVIFRKKPCVRR